MNEPLKSDLRRDKYELAYRLWEFRQCYHGNDQFDWYEAERILDNRFYHSFPRLRESQSIYDPAHRELGLAVLDCMVDIGLLLTPEEFSRSSGSEPNVGVVQQRFSLTLIPIHELPAHALRFGAFAIEFPIQHGRALGAFPVSYFPGDALDDPARVLGQSIVATLGKVSVVLERLSSLAEVVTHTMHGESRLQTAARDILTTLFRELNCRPHDLLSAVQATANYWYPTAHIEGQTCESRLAEFFRQREWRISNTFSRPGYDPFLSLTDDHVARIRLVSSDFVDRPIILRGREYPFPEVCKIVPEFEGRHPLEYAQRILVPGTCLDAAERIVGRLTNPPAVVAFP